MAKTTRNNTIKLKFDSARNLAPAPESKSAAQIKQQYDLFINGSFQKPQSKKYFATINPATEEKLSEVAQAGAADVNKAVDAAGAAYDKVWKKMPAKERAKYIYRIARMVQEKARELAIIETLDGGKPIRESRDFDIPTAANHLFYYAGWADKLEYAFPNRKAQPLGVAGQIIPWNFPLLMAAWKIAPALARQYSGVKAGRVYTAYRFKIGRNNTRGRFTPRRGKHHHWRR
jgi:aldehyde dehydrogenase (NAD+)